MKILTAAALLIAFALPVLAKDTAVDPAAHGLPDKEAVATKANIEHMEANPQVARDVLAEAKAQGDHKAARAALQALCNSLDAAGYAGVKAAGWQLEGEALSAYQASMMAYRLNDPAALEGVQRAQMDFRSYGFKVYQQYTAGKLKPMPLAQREEWLAGEYAAMVLDAGPGYGQSNVVAYLETLLTATRKALNK